jgi:predicted transcriptional regulator YdeE
MNKNIEQLHEIKLVGITVRTANNREMDSSTAKIGATMGKFFMEGIQNKIPNRKNPGKVFAVYTNYESDEHGEYDYFMGEEVDNFEDLPEGFEALIIPSQDYVKFTSNPGQMPGVIINMWQNIWKMGPSELGGARTYIADFQIHDERSHDPNNAIIDVYIGIKK